MIDCWIAYDRVEPIRDEWEHTGTVAAEVRDVARTVAASHGLQPLPPATNPADYRPVVPRQPRPRPGPSDESLRAIMNGTLRM